MEVGVPQLQIGLRIRTFDSGTRFSPGGPTPSRRYSVVSQGTKSKTTQGPLACTGAQTASSREVENLLRHIDSRGTQLDAVSKAAEPTTVESPLDCSIDFGSG